MTSKQLTLIQPKDNFGSALMELEQIEKYCGILMKTKHYQKMGPDGVFAIVSKAKILNIHPLEALDGGLYYVQGRVGMSAETMASLIRREGHSITKDPKSGDTLCILHGKRSDNGDTLTVKFSLDDAKRAGIYKGVWEKYPATMCFCRCMTMLGRQLFSDVIKGVRYAKDELVEIAKSNGKHEDLQEAEVEVFEEAASIAKEAEKEEEVTITSEQYDELSAMFDLCSPDYQEKLNTKLQVKKWNSLQNLPVNFYESTKKGLVEESVKYQQSMNKVEEVLEAQA